MDAVESTTATTEKAVDEVERQRRRLQESVDKLNKSIKIWQTWEAEYKILREELQTLGNDASTHAMDEIGGQCAGELLNQKEINLLTRDERKQPRTCPQVIGLLARRIEYVESNIKSLHGSLQAAEGKITASRALDSARQHNGEGYPLMEIQEELDDNDNIISSSMTPASEAAPHVIEALKKAGVPGLQSQRGSEPSSDSTKSMNEAEMPPSALRQTSYEAAETAHEEQLSPSTSESDTRGDDRKACRRRKSVTFADGTKQAPPTPPQPRPAKDVRAAKAASAARRVKAEVRGSIDALRKVHDAGYINEDVFDRFRREYIERLQNLPVNPPKFPIVESQASHHQQSSSSEEILREENFDPVIPPNESLEDAALRREMIRYNMDEIGAVVAEMNLDEDDHSQTSSPDYSNEENEHRASSDEDENDWGISTSRTLTPEYIKEMQALEERLKTGSSQFAEPSTTIEALLQAEEELVVGEDGKPAKKPHESKTSHRQKAVRFAPDQNNREKPPFPGHGSPSEPRAKKGLVPVHTDIVERPSQANSSPKPTVPSLKKKMSQSKNSRSAQASVTAPQKASQLQIQANSGNQIKTPSLPAFTPPATPKIAPTGPPDGTHAPTVIERLYPDRQNMENASEPDELDESLMRQELTMEYHRTRNRIIRRQGGFSANDEEEEADGPLLDKNGNKISRFKAARLNRVGG
ncbi:MAG: hypothetical protein L6R41_000034 [Letrouitia leprolyta]|nr:MAG: hypothetical protein L6R41_000034 [Letrouitia leprolyta]